MNEASGTTRLSPAAVAVASTASAGAGLSHVVSTLVSVIDLWRFDPRGFGIDEDDVRLLDWLGLHDTNGVVFAVTLVGLGLVGLVGLRHVYRSGQPSLTTLVAGLALAPVVHYLVLALFRSQLLV